jgi:hypothetical protein
MITTHTEALRVRAEGLRAWAEGMYGTGAVAELLIAYGPPLLSGPWVEHDPENDCYWFNTAAVTQHGGRLSGGERRTLEIAASLASPEHTIALGDLVAGLGRQSLELVLAAIAHAAGSHDHSRILTDPNGKPIGFEDLPSAYPWPAQPLSVVE